MSGGDVPICKSVSIYLPLHVLNEAGNGGGCLILASYSLLALSVEAYIGAQ